METTRGNPRVNAARVGKEAMAPVLDWLFLVTGNYVGEVRNRSLPFGRSLEAT